MKKKMNKQVTNRLENRWNLTILGKWTMINISAISKIRYKTSTLQNPDNGFLKYCKL